MKNAHPIAVCLLWLLHVLYSGSYLAMVRPGQVAVKTSSLALASGSRITYVEVVNYRFGDEWASRIYWPLEQIDRRLFPLRWPESPNTVLPLE